jgi:hypothetical protein
MAETGWLEDDLRRHASYINARRWRWPLLGPSYHLLADALVWIDEKPPWAKKLRPAEDALRCLWHHRTGLILGEERPFGELWELGRRLFPEWVGFHASRCTPSRKLQVFYRAKRIAADRCLRQVEGEFEQAPD